MVLLPTAFLPNTFYLALIAQGLCDGIWVGEPYQKQSYRSRCDLMTANGRLSFSLPIQHYPTPPPPISTIYLSEHGKWRHRLQHALKSNYHATPFWIHYEEAILSHIQATECQLLIDYNALWLNWLCDLWHFPKPLLIEEESVEGGQLLTEAITPQAWEAKAFPRYWQVFEERWGFQPNLSALDLLLNQGPEGRLYLLHLPVQEIAGDIIAR